MNVLPLIPKGKANAISRSQLILLTGLSDRKVRQKIEDLKHSGVLIANMQNGKGYFICETPFEALAYYETQESRARAILHSNKFFKMYVARSGIKVKGKLENQISLF